MDDITFSTRYCMCVQLAVVPEARTTLNLNIYLCNTYLYLWAPFVVAIKCKVDWRCHQLRRNCRMAQHQQRNERKPIPIITSMISSYVFLFIPLLQRIRRQSSSFRRNYTAMRKIFCWHEIKEEKMRWSSAEKQRSCDFERIFPFGVKSFVVNQLELSSSSLNTNRLRYRQIS